MSLKNCHIFKCQKRIKTAMDKNCKHVSSAVSDEAKAHGSASKDGDRTKKKGGMICRYTLVSEWNQISYDNRKWRSHRFQDVR